MENGRKCPKTQINGTLVPSFTALTQPFVNKQIFFWGPKQLFRYGELVELGFGHPEQVSGVENARK